MGKFIIADRFEIDDLEKDLLGRGGMGVVYRAIDNQSGETVAVKTLNSEALSHEPNILERFRREVESLRQLNHPNIVKFITAVESYGQHYLVMEYVDGGSLQDLLARHGHLSSQRAVEIGLDLADALTRAHHLGIIYRDLKPANVLLAQDGTPRLTDFGIAQLADGSRLTQTGVLVGTVNYLSPEALSGEVLDFRTDIWAFGVLLFEMLTGKLPFSGDNLTARITATLTQPVPDLAQYNFDIPKSLADLIYRMLEKDRQQRIPSMRQVGAELESILMSSQGLPTSVESRFKTPIPSVQNTKRELPTGTVTFLFTDIEGSTKLAQKFPDAMPAMIARHNEILTQVFESQHGYIFQIVGDSFAAAFHNANDAVNAALEAQRKIHNEAWAPAPIKVRMGIHTGAAQLQIESKDTPYSGYATLALTQRIMSAGHGGQILLSQTTHDLTRDRLPENAQLIDMGERRLKDILRPEKIYQLHIPDLPNEFPLLKTLDTHLNNLPVQLTPFIGREREITAVLGLMHNPDIRLVTLTGAGGTGKTRLSIQVAAELLDEYEHGVWFVGLASISNPDLVLPTIASVLKVTEVAGTPIEQSLHDHLHDLHILLVIDNFEQVVSAAPVIGKLLTAAPKVKVLVSSREVLHLRGEHDYPVPPLGLPKPKYKQAAAVMAQFDAIALFIQHARMANPSFELDEKNASIVAEICTRLDGLPLAIELAAVRSRLLKPVAMLEKLKSRLNILTGGARDLPQRQQTIRGAIDWSYDLLDEAEKVLFARLSVFTGGWTVELAEAVCGAGINLDILDGLESLLNKSLLRQFNSANGETRLTMLETIREYAFEKLTQNGELLTIQQAHADAIIALLEKAFAVQSGPEETIWFEKLDAELDNLRAAVDWCFAHDQPLISFRVGDLQSYWNQRANSREPLVWLERVLKSEITLADAERAGALRNAGAFNYYNNNLQQARTYFETALGLFRALDDQDGIARCLHNLGNLESWEKNFEKARQLYEQCLAGAVPNTIFAARTLGSLGSLARDQGDWQAARDYYFRAREIYVHQGDETSVSMVDWNLAGIALKQGDLVEARARYVSYGNARWIQVDPIGLDLLDGDLAYIDFLMGNKKDARQRLHKAMKAMQTLIEREGSEPFVEPQTLEGLARLDLSEGRVERAALLFGACSKMREKFAITLSEIELPAYEAVIAETRALLGDEAFEQAFAKGQSMSPGQILAFVLEESQ
jgi:predicted ATPase/serine/threonine protein kinase